MGMIEHILNELEELSLSEITVVVIKARAIMERKEREEGIR